MLHEGHRSNQNSTRSPYQQVCLLGFPFGGIVSAWWGRMMCVGYSVQLNSSNQSKSEHIFDLRQFRDGCRPRIGLVKFGKPPSRKLLCRERTNGWQLHDDKFLKSKYDICIGSECLLHFFFGLVNTWSGATKSVGHDVSRRPNLSNEKTLLTAFAMYW